MTVIAHRRLRAVLFLLHLGAHTQHRRRQRDGAQGRAAAGGHGVRAVPSDRDLRRRLPHHRGRARRGRLPDQRRGRALHGALRAERAQGPGLARRGLALDDHRNPRRAAASARTATTSTCISSISTRASSPSGCPGISETAKIFAGVDVTREPIPVLPTVHYNMGGVPTNHLGEVRAPADGDDPEAIVPGLMAIGEAACVSVHGANRLGSNSLLDLVVFGPRGGQCAVSTELRPGASHAAAAGRCRADRALPTPRRVAATPAAARDDCAALRREMQQIMQSHCAVFRTGEVLGGGQGQARKGVGGLGPTSGVSDRSMIWNSDLVEALELDNLIAAGGGHRRCRGRPQGKPRRARPRGLSRARRRELDEAHADLAR